MTDTPERVAQEPVPGAADVQAHYERIIKDVVACNFALSAQHAKLTDKLRAQIATQRGVLEDLESLFAYLDADAEVTMASDEEVGGHCDGLELCGYRFCAENGCVSMRLRAIREALAEPGQ
jgi:hypothetical protein